MARWLLSCFFALLSLAMLRAIAAAETTSPEIVRSKSDYVICGDWQRMRNKLASPKDAHAVFLPNGRGRSHFGARHHNGKWYIRERVPEGLFVTIDDRIVGLIDPEADQLRLHSDDGSNDVVLVRMTKWNGRFENGVAVGLWSQKIAESSLVIQEMTLEKGIQQGITRQFNLDGETSSECEYKNNLLHGVSRFWFEGGRLCREQRYFAGKEEGKRIVHSRIGDAVGEIIYKDGQPWEGEYLSLYPDGSKLTSGKIQNGEKVGVWTTFKPDGTVDSTRQYP